MPRSLVVFLMIMTVLFVSGCAHQKTGKDNQSSLETEEPVWLDNINRRIFSFNESVDKYLLLPVAKAYKYVVSDVIEGMIDNFFDHLSEPSTLVNSILQGKSNNTFSSFGRVVVNTTLGVGGLFDVASDLGIKANQEDFGQTLAVWGVNSGYYVVLPFFGGTTFRDGVASVANGYLNPLSYYDSNDAVRFGLVGLNVINIRVGLLGAENLKGGDLYEFRKQVFLQMRYSNIKDGEVEIELDELEWLDEDL